MMCQCDNCKLKRFESLLAKNKNKIKQGLKEVQLHKQGKIELRTWDEFVEQLHNEEKCSNNNGWQQLSEICSTAAKEKGLAEEDTDRLIKQFRKVRKEDYKCASRRI